MLPRRFGPGAASFHGRQAADFCSVNAPLTAACVKSLGAGAGTGRCRRSQRVGIEKCERSAATKMSHHLNVRAALLR